MGRHGENIRKRSDGRWEARYMSYDTGKGEKICRSVYGHTYEEVKKKRIEALRKPAALVETGSDSEQAEKQSINRLLLRNTALFTIATLKRHSTALCFFRLQKSLSRTGLKPARQYRKACKKAFMAY